MLDIKEIKPGGDDDDSDNTGKGNYGKHQGDVH